MALVINPGRLALRGVWSQRALGLGLCYLAVMNFMRLAALALVLMAAACGRSDWHATDISGAMPALDFSMTRANDGKPVSAADYRGKVVVLYFGYTHCPDVCPTTLANLSEVLGKLGARADEVRVLFVSVDPNRDSEALMKTYVNSFSPQIDGLRGTDNQLTTLARRYRIAYSVTPGTNYEVMHSNAVFFFGRDGKARLVTTSTDDVAGLTKDIQRLLE